MLPTFFIGFPACPYAAFRLYRPDDFSCTYRGSFEVRRSGSVLDLCGGIQAHLSTCASPRVSEVVRNFPQKLSLIEVPRLSAWPTQFCDSGAKEDNIALYFFAKDLERFARVLSCLDQNCLSRHIYFSLFVILIYNF